MEIGFEPGLYPALTSSAPFVHTARLVLISSQPERACVFKPDILIIAPDAEVTERTREFIVRKRRELTILAPPFIISRLGLEPDSNSLILYFKRKIIDEILRPPENLEKAVTDGEKLANIARLVREYYRGHVASIRIVEFNEEESYVFRRVMSVDFYKYYDINPGQVRRHNLAVLRRILESIPNSGAYIKLVASLKPEVVLDKLIGEKPLPPPPRADTSAAKLLQAVNPRAAIDGVMGLL